MCAYEQQKFISHCSGSWRSKIRFEAGRWHNHCTGNREVPGLRLFVKRLKEGPGVHLHGLSMTSTAQVRSHQALIFSCVQCEGPFLL